MFKCLTSKKTDNITIISSAVQSIISLGYSLVKLAGFDSVYTLLKRGVQANMNLYIIISILSIADCNELSCDVSQTAI